jgi:hypothetical protein
LDRLCDSLLFSRRCSSEEAINFKQLTGDVMLRKTMMLTCVLVLSCSGASNAKPLDSPGLVYIDGLPCNRLCRSYLAWSHHLSSMPARGRPFAIVRPGIGMRGEASKHASRARIAKAKPVAPNSRQVPRARVAGLQPAGHAAAKPVAPKSNRAPQARIADLQPAANAATASDNTATKPADPHPTAGSAAGSNAKTIQEQVTAATAAAVQMMAAKAIPAAERKANHTGASDHPEAVLPADAHKAAAASANDTDVLVVLVMARPEIRSVSDLASKTIAIDEAQAVSNGNVRAAIVAAGAAEVQLSDDQTKAVDRLISGAVPAAVLAVVSPDAALRFPDIEGFKIFQVLLLPRSLKAVADTPKAK